jgi:hypothetical protein
MGAKRRDSHGRNKPPAPSNRKGTKPQKPTDRYEGELGISRIPLTLLEHEGEIWNVYLSSFRDTPADERMQLEFERTGTGGAPVRYTRAAAGSVLRALQEGQSLTRAALRDELARAVAGGELAGAADTEGRVRSWRPLSDSEGEGTASSG